MGTRQKSEAKIWALAQYYPNVESHRAPESQLDSLRKGANEGWGLHANQYSGYLITGSRQANATCALDGG